MRAATVTDAMLLHTGHAKNMIANVKSGQL
jgi:hypothetical protein